MRSRFFGLFLALAFSARGTTGRRAAPTGAVWSPRPCPNPDLFSTTPPAFRLISGTERWDRLRFCFSAIPIAPISARCTWRILGRL